MNVATSVGVRELKDHLSRYLERVRQGEEIVVTDRGNPVARLTSIDASTDRLADLIASGVVQAPTARSRRRPRGRIVAEGTVSDLVAEQRR
jgi:prevent-host-death family protein